MGTGKTFIGAAAAHMAGFERILIICPPHLVPKWKREVEMTVPGVRAAIVESITDLERLRLSVGSGPLFAVMSREKAKLSYRWMPAVIQRWASIQGQAHTGGGDGGSPSGSPAARTARRRSWTRTACHLTEADLNRRKHTCAGCGSPLWQADRSGPARYPLADYIKHRMKGFFDLLIGDEVHEFKGARECPGHRRRHPRRRVRQVPQPHRDAPRRLLLDHLPPALPLLAGDSGRSSDVPTSTAGFSGTASRRSPSASPTTTRWRTGATAVAASYRKVVRERPGLVPSALFHIIGNTVFLQTGGRCLRPAGLRGEDPRCPRWTRRRTRRATPSARPTTPCSRS